MDWGKIRPFRTALLLLAAFVLISYGVWLVYAPAGFIVGGMLLAVIEWLTTPTSEGERRRA